MAHADDLPLPDYDQLALSDLQHRVRSLASTASAQQSRSSRGG